MYQARQVGAHVYVCDRYRFGFSVRFFACLLELYGMLVFNFIPYIGNRFRIIFKAL
jgi:hypothetical protein